MDDASWGALATGGGSLIALVGVIVAIWQARTARVEARAARRASSASVKQAKSARQQVELLREQVAADKKTRDKQEAPAFELESSPMVAGITSPAGDDQQFRPILASSPVPYSGWVFKQMFKLTLSKSPGDVNVSVRVLNSDGGTMKLMEGQTPVRMIENSTQRMAFLIPYESKDDPFEVEISASEVAGEHRQWRSHKSLPAAD